MICRASRSRISVAIPRCITARHTDRERFFPASGNLQPQNATGNDVFGNDETGNDAFGSDERRELNPSWR